jgi:hypothetical protein
MADMHVYGFMVVMAWVMGSGGVVSRLCMKVTPVGVAILESYLTETVITITITITIQN